MYFKQHAPTLLKNGYMLVPLVLNQKNPILRNWASCRLTVEHVDKYANSGIGILTGQGNEPIIALDIDTLNADLAAEFKTWCFENLGETCERIGKAPKSLLIYRVTETITKKASKNSFNDRLEILGKGQQFVAYNKHPETGLDYRWTDLYGGLMNMPISLVPVITKVQIDKALAKFEDLIAKHAQTDASNDDLLALLGSTKLGIDLTEAERLLSFVDNSDYDTWLRAGMALHHEFDGAEAALQLWDVWSSSAKNYKNFKDLEHRWAYFSANKNTAVNATWLLKQEKVVVAIQKKEKITQELQALKVDIETCEHTEHLLNNLTPKAGVLSQDDPAFTADLELLIRSTYKKLTNAELSASAFKNAFNRDLEKQQLTTARLCTEFANADRMYERYGDGLLYDAQLLKWYIWGGTYWRTATDSELAELARQTIEYLNDEKELLTDEKAKKQLAKFYLASQRAVMCKNMIFLLQSYKGIYIFNAELDNNLDIVAVKNGTLNVRTGQFFAADPRYKLTRCMNANYNPNASCPLFEQTLSEAFYGNEIIINFFQRLMGYILLGRPVEDLLILPYGGGSNGKSTIFNAIINVLGMYSRTAASDLFLSNGVKHTTPGGAREDLLHLKGSRFVYVSEPDEDGVLKEGIIKAVTGGDNIVARGLYSKHTIEFKATWTTIMPTNHKPIVKGYDLGMWRRLLLIPFTRCFESDPLIVKDTERGENLLKEADGILTWLLKGTSDYLKYGLMVPKVIQNECDSYRNEMDLLKPWLDEHCKLSDNNAESLKALWLSWQSYAQLHNISRMIPTSIALSKQLHAKGFIKVRDSAGIRGIGFVGLKLSDDIFIE